MKVIFGILGLLGISIIILFVFCACILAGKVDGRNDNR